MVRGMVEDPEFRADLKQLVINSAEQIMADPLVRHVILHS